MSRRLVLSVAALAAVLLVGAGVLAGVLIASGDDSESASADTGPAYLGASVENLPFNVANVVTGIDRDSPAAKAGLKFGDSIQSLDGQSIKTSQDIDKALQAKQAGDKVSLAYWRMGENKTADIRLSKAPKEGMTQEQGGELEFGSVKSASDKSVTIGVALTNREVTYDVSKSTRFWRSYEPIKASDLKSGDIVMVISVDGGKTALAGLAYK